MTAATEEAIHVNVDSSSCGVQNLHIVSKSRGRIPISYFIDP